MPPSAVLICNGPSAMGYAPPEGAYVLCLNDGFMRHKADAVFTSDCEVPQNAWLAFEGRRIQAAHNPCYAMPDRKRDELFECRAAIKKYRSSAAAALAWLVKQKFGRCAIAGMDAASGGGKPGARYTTAGHREMLREFASQFPQGLFLVCDGVEVAVDEEFLATLVVATPAAAEARPSAQSAPAGRRPGAPPPAPPATPLGGQVPLIVAYYTTGTPYEVEAKLLRISLDGLDLPAEVVGVPNLGTWQKNTQFKAHFLKQRLLSHPGRALLYVDVDAIVVRPPLPPAVECDVAANHPYGRHELNSGCLYLANTPKCLELMDRWLALNEKYPDKLPDGRDAWDQRTLEMAIRETPGCRFAELPDEYDWIPGITARQRPGLNPTIIMTRGAYRLKSQIDEQPGDVVPWVVFPSVNPERAARCARAWHDWNYRVAVLIEKSRATDAEAEAIGADKLLRSDEWRGFPHAANLLCHAVDGPVVVVIGDDITPHPQESGPVLARRFLKRFPDTFGVMQPTGDVWGGFAQACISPWIGRAFIDQAYGGRGPYWEEYFHFFCDQELQEVAAKLGVFEQVPDIIQYHDHWERRGVKRPEHLRAANEQWEACRDIFLKRQGAGFPGHEPLAVSPRPRVPASPRRRKEVSSAS